MAEALAPILPNRIDALAHQVLNEACLRRFLLATAESCTGGLLASLLTDVPGCSHAFDRGFVIYTDESKTELLGVSARILTADGAVSRACAVAMAEGALQQSRAELAVSVTGWAEGGPEPNQIAGLVYFACARQRRATLHRRREFGEIGRAAVRLGCLETALELFVEQLTG